MTALPAAVREPRTLRQRFDIARCDQEIAEIMHRPDVQAGEVPAWLVALGVNDCEVEKLLIEGRA